MWRSPGHFLWTARCFFPINDKSPGSTRALRVPVDTNDNENNEELERLPSVAASDIPLQVENVSSQEQNFNAWMDKLKVQYK